MHPEIPSHGGIFEGFAIEFAESAKSADSKRALSAESAGGWTLIRFGHSGTEFELRPTHGKLSPRQAWNRTYELRALPGVVYAEPMFSVSVSDNPAWIRKQSQRIDGHLEESSNPEWSLDAIRAREAWLRFFPDPAHPPGEGVLIGHPDTGYQDHPELEGRILAGKGYDFVYEDRDAHDDLERPLIEPIPTPGHGTGTASIIVSPPGATGKYSTEGWVTGVAPAAQIIPLRAAHSVMLTSMGNLARAIEYATNAGAHVISISMGGLFSWRLRRAVRYAQSHGVIICAAAGNYAPFVGWPAAYDEVIACAASNAQGGTWSWSCRGKAVDVTAPGESVWRATVRKEEDDIVYDVGRGFGTSLSTTLTAGVAALWLSHHGRDALIERYGAENLAAVFQQVLRDACVKFPGWKKDKFGAGLVDAVRTLELPLPSSVERTGDVRMNMDAHPAIDRGGLATFMHLFELSDASEAELSKALAGLLATSGEDLPAVLDAVGQELAFHLATDPEAYFAFDRALHSSSQIDLDGLRALIGERASEPLAVQLIEDNAPTPSVDKSSAPHL